MLRLVKGHKYGLVGRNGAGKTTLLRHIAIGDIDGFPRDLRIMHVEQEVRIAAVAVFGVAHHCHGLNGSLYLLPWCCSRGQS